MNLIEISGGLVGDDDDVDVFFGGFLDVKMGFPPFFCG
jgi:hypothetical protein